MGISLLCLNQGLVQYPCVKKKLPMNVIQQLIHGERAFYRTPDYTENTRADFRSTKALEPPIYTHNTESKVWRVAKQIFSILIFPIGLYQLAHSLAGKFALLPAATPQLMGLEGNYPQLCRQGVNLSEEWKYKRISIEIDGYTIDATIMGKASTFGNGRWVLDSNGNGEFAEQKLRYRGFKQIVADFNANAIVFNYPGVGASTGMPNRAAMTKAYQAILNFLEDQENGIGASEIIGYGHSIGGGVQGDALLDHRLKSDVKYCFVKSRSFSNLSAVAEERTGSKLLAFLLRFFGWNLSSTASSMRLQAPEVILQTANTYYDCENMEGQPGCIRHDGIIAPEASHANALMRQNRAFAAEKVFLGIRAGHNDSLPNRRLLVSHVNRLLHAKIEE